VLTERLVRVALRLHFLDVNGQAITVAGRVVEEDMTALVGHGVELAQIAPLGRSDAPGAEVSEPGEVLAVDGVLGDACLFLHRLGGVEALLAVGVDLRPDLFAARL
jgi:hypothetical protein